MAIEIPPIQVHGSRSRVLFFIPRHEKDRKFANPNIIKLWDGEVHCAPPPRLKSHFRGGMGSHFRGGGQIEGKQPAYCRLGG